MKKHWTWGALGSMLMISLVYIGCSSSGSDNPGSLDNRPETITYTGPGSFYSAVLNSDGTFEIEIREQYSDVDPELTVTGMFEPLDNGVLELTVGGFEPASADGPENGEKAYGVEALGYGLFLLPLGGDEMIPMLASGGCPTADFDANWIVAQAGEGENDQKNAMNEDQDFFGVFRYDHDTLTATLPKTYALGGDFNDLGPGNFPDIELDCENGFLPVPADEESDSDPINFWFSEIGGVMVEAQEESEEEGEYVRNSTIFALPSDANTVADLEGTFRGILFESDPDADEGIDPDNFFIEITFNTDGTGVGYPVTSVNPWTVEAGEAGTIELEAFVAAGDGWYKGTLVTESEGGEAVANIGCTFTANISGTTNDILLCVGQSSGDIGSGDTIIDEDEMEVPFATSINFILVKN